MGANGSMDDPGAHESAIAIVGMAGRFPGARDVDAYWRNLRDGVESIRRFEAAELEAEGVSAASLADPHYVRAGAPLDDMELFDAGFFGLSPLDASILDPQHRHFLECCWEALESAGHDPQRFPGSIGVFGGSGHNAYLPYNLLTNPELLAKVGFFLLRHTGNDKDFLTTRVSYCFDLRGPSVNVQTACSTSLVAVHLAGQSLLAHECDMALAGGVTVELPHRRGYVYQEGEILSPDGHCRAFDADAAGTVFGSAAGVVVLRRLADALEDADPILAVIRGSAINNDGAGKVGYLAPSVDGQAEAISEALAVADVPAASIRYVEAHGTGTAVGDPIEIAALSQAFADAPRGGCAIGSVKTNIGHCDTAAGVASLIKVVQALRHGELPPSLHYRAANPAIDFASSPFTVNASLQAFPAGEGPRRAGVSSLGVGGTNAHVVVEEAPARAPSAPATGWQVLPVSARSPGAVQAATDRLADHLRRHPDENLADVAWTLQTGRRAFAERRVAVGRSAAELIDALESEDGERLRAGRAPETARTVAFLFPGGGAQHPGMGRGLYESEPVYREQVDAGLALLEPDHREAIRRLLLPAAGEEEAAALEFERPSLQLPALFLTELALARLWMSWGVRPAALAGHSMGENTAACLAGVFRLEDALALVSLRGRLFERVPAGGMLSVPLPAAELEPLLGEGLDLGAVNAPDLCVASGPLHALVALEARLRERDVESRRIRIAIAAHSAMLEPILAEWSEFLSGLPLRAPEIPFVSNVTGTWIRDEEATDPAYWVRHLRSPVRFADDVATLFEEPQRVLLEVGPGRTLTSLARASAACAPGHAALVSLRHPEQDTPDPLFVRRVLGDLWAAGVEIDWRAVQGEGVRHKQPLPTYPWEHQRHWIEPGRAAPASAGEAGGAGTELRKRPDVADWFSQPVWHRQPLAAGPACESVVVLGEGGRLDEALGRRLREGGGRVVQVTAGDRYERLAADRYRVKPDRAEDWAALVQDLADPGPLPVDWLHLWSAAPPGDAVEALDGLAAETELGFHALLGLGQALAGQDPDAPLHLRVVASGSQQVGGEDLAVPARALARGPCRVLPRELPGLLAQHVDVDRRAGDEAELAARLESELRVAPEAACVAWRGDQRFVQRFEPLPLAPAPTPHPSLRERGVYLVTGGLGGLGRLAAGHLAESVRARLVLVGRHGLPPRERWAECLAEGDGATARAIRGVQAMEAAGAEVLPVAADVSDRDAMERVVAEARARFGPIQGVVHAAGTLDDQLVVAKTAASADAVLAPKVRGSLVLDQVLRDEPLDFFLMYSSISAIAGLPGQIDYTAANAFLDAFASHRARHDGGASRSLAWSAWQQVGMAADRAEELGLAASRPAELPAPAHPLLDRCLARDAARTAFASDMGVADRWVLDEHRLRGGVPLLPGTGFLELTRAAFESPPQDRVVEIRDALFLAPFPVPEGERREIRVELRGGPDRAAFSVTSTPDAADPEAVVEHACGEIAYTDVHAPGVCDLEALRARCGRVEEVEGLRFQQHLAFGRRWDVLRRVHWGEGEALLTLELAPGFAEDLEEYLLHPALLDMATAGAQALVPGNEDEQAMFIPVSTAELRLWRPLEQRIYSHVRFRGVPEGAGEDFAGFDVTILDDGGRTLASVEGFVLKRIDDPAGLDPLDAVREAVVRRAVGGEAEAAGARSGAPPVLAHLDQAILPAEGLDALDRALAVSGVPQLVVSSLELEAWIAAVTAPPEPAAREPASREVELTPDLLAGLRGIEATLETHPAVLRAAAMAFEDRPGQRRLAAFLVHDPDQDATVSELRRHLRKSQAESWIPASFVELDELPVGTDGELDRRALPDPFGSSSEDVAPRTPTEQALAEVWCEVLGLERLGVHDNFFDLGGHSLLAMRAIARIDRRLGVKLDNAMMVLQTLEQIAAECDQRLGTGAPAPREPGEGTPAGPPSDPQSERQPAEPRKGLGSRLLRAVKRGR